MSRSKRKLAASFVMTISALPAAASLEGCKKTPVDPPETPTKDSHSVYRNGDHCLMHTPEHCPKGASCNPPAPPEIDCPPSHRDAGEPDPRPERPPGKEGWLRVQPHLHAGSYGCTYQAERFCSPPGTPVECTPWPPSVTIKCKPSASLDGGADAGRAATPRGPYTLEPFTYKDGLGVCHKIPALECGDGDCTKKMPAGEVTPCP